MLKTDDVRRMALELPEAVELPHFGVPSFRVNGKIFATVPDEGTINLMLGSDEMEVALATAPRVFRPLEWGGRVVGVSADLGQAARKHLEWALHAAWVRKAPKRLHKLR